MAGVRAILVPDTIDDEERGESLAEQVKKVMKKERRKWEDRHSGNQTMEMLSDVMVFSSISNAQQQILSHLQAPPLDALNKPVTAIDVGGWPGTASSNAAALRWAVNGVAKIGAATYNAISALRAEVLMSFLDAGMDPRRRRSGAFGGGVAGLLILTSFGGGGFGLGSIFGGGMVQQTGAYGGLA